MNDFGVRGGMLFALVRRLAPVGRYCSGRDTFSSGASLVRWGDLLQWEIFDLVGGLGRF